MSIELSGTNVLISICLLTICIIVFIFSLRKIYHLRKENVALEEDHDLLKNRNKYQSVNTLKNFGFNFKLGFACSLAFVLLSFSWTTYDNVQFFDIPEGISDDVIQEIPRTIHELPPPPPPPPPPPVLIEVPDEPIPDEEELDFVDQSVTDEDVVVAPPIAKPTTETTALLTPAPEIKEDITEIVYVPESMPRFPGCEGLTGSKDEKKACADKKMLEYIYSKLRYPEMALSIGIEGTVVVQFVVNKEGSVSDINVVRKIGAGCDEAAAKVISDMNKLSERWTPGNQMGRNVRVMYTLPIKFKLLK